MALDHARLGDRTFGTCSHPSHNSPIAIGGTIVSAATSVGANSQGSARLGDTVVTDCGHTGVIVSSSGSVSAEFRSIARLSDQVAGDYSAVIVSSSTDVSSG